MKQLVSTLYKQKIIVFQENNSGEKKIKGIRKYGKNFFDIETFSIDADLPAVIDNTDEYFPVNIDADLVLDFFQHPDLSWDLAKICYEKNIPIVASGKKINLKGVITPPT